MAEKRKIITFESLNHIKEEDNENILINKNYWKNENFLKIFFQRTKKFSTDENEIKKEFATWHKELGRKYYNQSKDNFKLDSILLKEKKYSFHDILLFIKFHPLLTRKDEKKIIMINEEIKNNFRRIVVFNTFSGLLISISLIKLKSKINKVQFHITCRENYFKFMFLFILSMLVVDINFKLKKPYLLVDKLITLKMTEKYFQNYL